VQRFENKTSEFGLADEMTDLIIDAFIADGNLKVVAAENAEAILIGTLTRYERRPYQFDETDVVTSYSVDMTFEIALSKVADGSDIWKEIVTQRGVYQVDIDTEDDARQRAIALLVETVINKTTKSW
jgi:hypothetical protein